MSIVELNKSLKRTIKTCDVAIAVIKSATPFDVVRDLQLVHKDFLSLLQLMHSYTTRLCVALGKQPPTYSAAIPTLATICEHVSNLASCSRSFNDQAHGKTLAKEARWAAEEVLDSLRALLSSFQDQTAPKDAYLAKMGTIHETCERLASLSRTNQEAVAKKWTLDLESIEDAVRELEETTNHTGSQEPDGWDDMLEGDELFEDEEFGQSGKSNGQQMTSEEELRAKKVLTLLNQTCEFHARIRKSILDTSTSEATEVQQLDRLLELSAKLVETSDDLASSLHPPHTLPEISQALDQHSLALEELQRTAQKTYKTSTLDDVSSLTEGLESVGIGDRGTSGHLPSEISNTVDTIRKSHLT